MKKFKLLLSLFILFFTLYSCNEQLEISGQESINSKESLTKEFKSVTDVSEINYCGETDECTSLWAGQNIDAGTITVGNDDTNLYVTVYSTDGFQAVDDNIKMWVGTDLPTKRPAAGNFPYKVTESGNTHTFEIPLSTIDGWSVDCGENASSFYIVVHADVKVANGDGFNEETAWGGCLEGAGNAWWNYMEYTPECCDEEEECMDAFGFKYLNPDHSICLDYMDSDVKELVWSNNFNYYYLRNNRHYQFSLIANAEECVPQGMDGTLIDDAAIVVGYIDITMFSEGEGDSVQLYTTISYHITNDDYELSDANLYLSDIERPDDLNPSNGDYNYGVSSAEWDSLTTTFEKLPWPGTYSDWDTFVIPHAKVCKK